MKKTYFFTLLFGTLFCVPAQANYNTTCQNIGGFVHCNTYDYGSAAPSNYGANWGNSFLSGLNAGMQARKNAIETQNALLQQQILLQQAQQMAQQQQPKISSCKIDKIVGKEFPVGRVELVLTRVASDKYQIVGTDAYVLTKDCFRYMEKQPVIADINYSPSDRIYFE
ncbi:MAG: hypothetical protein IJS34_01030 [Alphaproteobacteria bacterium]|nr:hypothetical protein [Alphaproteobacteria bacterium]